MEPVLLKRKHTPPRARWLEAKPNTQVKSTLSHHSLHTPRSVSTIWTRTVTVLPTRTMPSQLKSHNGQMLTWMVTVTTSTDSTGISSLKMELSTSMLMATDTVITPQALKATCFLTTQTNGKIETAMATVTTSKGKMETCFLTNQRSGQTPIKTVMATTRMA